MAEASRGRGVDLVELTDGEVGRAFVLADARSETRWIANRQKTRL